MYHPQHFDFGFVVLCPDRNIGGLKNTVRSIKNHCYEGPPVISVLPKNSTQKEKLEAKEICETVQCNRSYHSIKEDLEDVVAPFINRGINHSKSSWNFIIIAGSYVRLGFSRRFSIFLKDEKDILFPILDYKYRIYDATFNGLLFHKDTFKDIGPFDESTPFNLSRLVWGINAKSKGYRFKAILGAKII